MDSMHSNQIPALIICITLLSSASTVLISNDTEEDDRLLVAVTLPWQREMVERIGGEHVKVATMVGAADDPHSGGGLTPSQIVSVAKSAIYFCVGSGVEWEEINLPTLKNEIPSLQTVNLSENIDLLSYCDHENGEEHHHGSVDPHVWTSIENLRTMALTVKDKLIELDTDNSQTYEQGFEDYEMELDDLKGAAQEAFDEVNTREFYVWHSAWQYLAEEWDLTETSLKDEYSGLSIGKLANFLSNIGVDTIFASPKDEIFENAVLEGINVICINPLAEDWLTELEKFITELSNVLRCEHG
ncbi:MAG TPA: zinc ABC transporter solute-binding protein [Candidatus Methanomethylophilaceae archaeon]|nr:zinc ABC transporter solute-binding protein [Candidatus Methanomethylophilaceae archaeon]